MEGRDQTMDSAAGRLQKAEAEAAKKPKGRAKPKALPPALQDDRLPSLKERYSKAQVEDAIVKCGGRWAAIAAELNCSYFQLRVWMTHNPKHAELADQLRQSIVDEAEQVMRDLLYAGDEKTRLAAAQFVLKTLGRTKGYMDRPDSREITVKDGEVSIRDIFGI